MRHLLAFFVFAFFLAVSASAFADAAADQAKAYVDSVAGQAVGIIKQTQDGKLDETTAKKNFRVILNNSFDIQTIAKFTVGKYWRVATPQEQSQIVELIKANILDKYADQLLESSGNKYTMDSARQINDTDYGVTMTGYSKDNQPVEFGWRLRKAGSGFKVIDISVEGVSMSVTHRSDFANTIERNGGKVSALITALQNREFSDK